MDHAVVAESSGPVVAESSAVQVAVLADAINTESDVDHHDVNENTESDVDHNVNQNTESDNVNQNTESDVDHNVNQNTESDVDQLQDINYQLCKSKFCLVESICTLYYLPCLASSA